MGTIEDLTPLNLATERATFFSTPGYNPQFEYRSPLTVAQLTQWGLPNQKLAEYCQRMLVMIQDQPKPTTIKQRVTPADVQAGVDAFNQHYQLAQPIELQFNPNLIAQCRIRNRIIEFKLPITYNQAQLDGVFRHELETHYLRIYNQALQPWNNVAQSPDHFRRTEEGLASLHGYLFSHRTMRKTFRTYLATWLAQQHSFRETFDILQSYGVSDTMAWLHTVRAKRGVTDSSQPGGQTKDICYLEGSLAVWSWLQDPKHDPHDLYLGRIALSDIPVLKSQSVKEGLLYPTFFQDMPRYIQAINEVGIQNHYHEIKEVIDVTA